MRRHIRYEELLKQRSDSLQPIVTRVSESVYCASDYSPANISMIVGEKGIVIIDTGMFPAHAQAVMKEFRKITNQPVAAIILTHGHGDHTGGTGVFCWGPEAVIKSLLCMPVCHSTRKEPFSKVEG